MKKIINLFLNSLKVRQFLKEIAMSSILPKYSEKNFISALALQVNLCQKLLFLHQLTHNTTTDCSLSYKSSIHENSKLRTCCVQKLFLTFRTIYVHNKFSPSSAKIRASDKDLPVNRNLPNKTCKCTSTFANNEVCLDLKIPNLCLDLKLDGKRGSNN